MHSAAPELAPRGVERGLIGTIVISALVHVGAIGLLVAMPGRFLSAPPRVQSYTVDLVAPDVIGGTNLLPGGGPKKPVAAKLEPQAAEPAPAAVPPPQAVAPPPAAEPVVPPPPLAEAPEAIEPAKPVEAPQPQPQPPVAAEPPKPPPKPVDAKPADAKPEPKAPEPKPKSEVKPPQPAKPAEALKGKPAAEAPKPKAVAENKPAAPAPPSAAPAKAKPAEKPPAPAAQKPAPEKDAAKPAEAAKSVAKVPPKTAPSKAVAVAPTPAAKQPVDEAQRRDQAIRAAVQKRAAEEGQRAATGKAVDDRIAAAVQKRAQQLEKGGSGAPSAGGPISAGPGSGVGGTPTDLQYVLYEGRMRERIKNAWAWSGADRSLTVIIQFNVAPDGQIRNVHTIQSSGDTSYDASAERAVRAVNPLEPVPEKYRDAFATVELTFRASDLES